MDNKWLTQNAKTVSRLGGKMCALYRQIIKKAGLADLCRREQPRLAAVKGVQFLKRHGVGEREIIHRIKTAR